MNEQLQIVEIGDGPLRARLVNRGASVAALTHDEIETPLVLGYDDPADYLTDAEFMGAIVGRVANRIEGAEVELDGARHRLVPNEGPTILHGGPDGTWAQLWTLEAASETEARFTLTLADGHMGFPGELRIEALYACSGETLSMSLTATTDRATFCNLASHIYYARSPDARLMVPADTYQPVTNGIPDGDPETVAGTRFDYRTPSPIASPIDHNLCLSRHRAPCREIAVLDEPKYRLAIASTEAGLQIYDGGHLDLPGGIGGRHYRAGDGLALEPQAWVDAPRRAWADQVILRPGETYAQETRIIVIPR
jgi:aldose 1-epimerase